MLIVCSVEAYFHCSLNRHTVNHLKIASMFFKKSSSGWM